MFVTVSVSSYNPGLHLAFVVTMPVDYKCTQIEIQMKIVHADPHYEKQRLGARDKYLEASTISSQLLHGDCSHGW